MKRVLCLWIAFGLLLLIPVISLADEITMIISKEYLRFAS